MAERAERLHQRPNRPSTFAAAPVAASAAGGSGARRIENDASDGEAHEQREHEHGRRVEQLRRQGRRRVRDIGGGTPLWSSTASNVVEPSLSAYSSLSKSRQSGRAIGSGPRRVTEWCSRARAPRTARAAPSETSGSLLSIARAIEGFSASVARAGTAADGLGLAAGPRGGWVLGTMRPAGGTRRGGGGARRLGRRDGVRDGRRRCGRRRRLPPEPRTAGGGGSAPRAALASSSVVPRSGAPPSARSALAFAAARRRRSDEFSAATGATGASTSSPARASASRRRIRALRACTGGARDSREAVLAVGQHLGAAPLARGVGRRRRLEPLGGSRPRRVAEPDERRQQFCCFRPHRASARHGRRREWLTPSRTEWPTPTGARGSNRAAPARRTRARTATGARASSRSSQTRL